MKQNFSNLSPQIQLIFSSIPVYVSSTANPDEESSQQTIARQEIFLKLRKGIRWKLASFETGDKIQAIGQKYQFELLRLANITRLIREYYFGEVRFENFPAEIEKRMGVSLLTAQEITRYLKQEIIDWDPWAEYIAKLPKMPVREIAQRFPKIAGMEITAGYIELKGSDDLEDPSIKNWLKDYISHLGYDHHSQMDRTQYIFHSENGKNLSSQDREKLGIILKSFDENIPLPVDEENGEIVFESVSSEPASSADRQRTVHHNPMPAAVLKSQPTPIKQDSFIKPYSPIQQPQKQASRPAPVRTAPPQNFVKPNPIPQPMQETIHSDFATQSNRQVNPEINKYFNAPETPDIPSIKIHSITEHNEPRIAQQQVPPRPIIQRPAPPQPAARPKYKIIDPFFSKPRPEPRLDGNIVDLSEREE